MDIPQASNAIAVLTLGKDLTFRDYAQAAYRMRGIGKGQRIIVFVSPQVEPPVHHRLRRVRALLAGTRVAARCCRPGLKRKFARHAAGCHGT